MADGKLSTYRAKRDFAKTREPVGRAAAAAGSRFVVHKHAATNEHYDLRLELDGVLKSWAVPKGPSLNPADKRLAVQTEDHPIEYLEFEGVIPAGEYGGGEMIVWDAGTWAPMEDAAQGLASGAFKFRLAGEKLKGGWMLARLKPKPGDKKLNWLLFKERDSAADAGTDILRTRPESVKTGRPIEALRGAETPLPKRPARLRPGALTNAVKAALPARVEPQLANSAEHPPKGAGWLHELKFDGYRTAAHLAEGGVRLITRSGLDWTKRYGELGAAFATLPAKQALLDGEIVVLDAAGVSRFGALQDALASGASHKLVFYAFDLLHLDGYDLTAAPLEQRKALLGKLLAGHAHGGSPIQFSDHIAGDGDALYRRASELGLEGIVSKRGNAPYQPGRSKTWVKAKALKTGDFVIAGYTRSAAAGGLAALVLAAWSEGELVYRGKCGTGFDAATLTSLLERLEALGPGAAPFAGAPKDVVWVRPVLSAHVHYSNITGDGLLRHSVFHGLREPEITAVAAAERTRLISDADLAAIWVTNPDRRLFGKSGPTKLDIAVYYALAGDFMLPHIVGRPVSLVRCPTGRLQDCFFQRHAFTGMPPTVAGFETQNSDGEDKTYLSVEDAKGYLALAQFGVVEFHCWGALRKRLDRPDRVVFDLDPGEGIAWREVVEAGLHVKTVLAEMGLVPFVKTSGGKGLHVVAPLKPRLGWKEIHQATGRIAAAIAAGAPDTFTTVMGKENRKRRIFVDFHRNARSATWAAPYSLRTRPHLPASTPLAWSDLESIDAPEDLNYSSLPGLLTMSGDAWATINESARELPLSSRAPR